jgi:hypothetical protein
MQSCAVQLVKDAVSYSKVLYYLLVKILMNRLWKLFLIKMNAESIFDLLKKIAIIACVLNTVIAMFDGSLVEFLNN